MPIRRCGGTAGEFSSADLASPSAEARRILEDTLAEFDSPWKQVCERFFPEMLELVLNEAYSDIDWSHAYRVLDKELPKISPDHQTGRRYADKLIEVRLKDGGQKIVFVHLEFQNQIDRGFSKRMFTYNCRISDKFQQDAVSIAILGDRSPTWRPKPYRRKMWGFDLSMVYPVVKLLDYADRIDELIASRNPFAAVILAFLAGQATRRNPQRRFVEKTTLVRQLYQKQFSRKTIVHLFQFIDWTLQLPPQLAQQFRTDLEHYEGEKKMPYITSIERMARKEGCEEGLTRGREEGLTRGREEGLTRGREEGMEQGLKKGMAKTLTTILVQRFGSLSEVEQQRIQQAEREQLERWIVLALTISEPSALFQQA